MGQNYQQATLARLAMAIILMCFSPALFAYLDPSTGSMLVSAIVGIAASIALAVKTYWYRIKSLLRRSRKSTAAAAKDSSPDQ